MSQKQKIEEMGMVNAMLESDLLAASEKIRDLEAEVERLTKERDAFRSEARNERELSEHIVAEREELIIDNERITAANTAMREALEQLIEDYHRRQQSATAMLKAPNTTADQRVRLAGKKAVYRDILIELNRILPVKGEGAHGQIEADQ